MFKNPRKKQFYADAHTHPQRHKKRDQKVIAFASNKQLLVSDLDSDY